MKYLNLFIAFLRAGVLCFGGGPASVPFIHREVVLKYKWMNDKEFADVLAIGNTLPGPINTKLSGYIGQKVAGFSGLLIATLAFIIPTSVLMIVLMTTLSHFSEFAWARGMTQAMVPVVGIMLAIMGWQFLSLAAKSLKWPVTILHIVIVGGLLWFTDIHPAFILAALFIWAFIGEKVIKIFSGKKK